MKSVSGNLLDNIQTVATGLGSLKEKVVFVGGATTLFYVRDKPNHTPRATDDVDCILKVGSKAEFARLEDELRKKGFSNDPKIICRWTFDALIVDVMPTDEKFFGFSNRWYEEGYEHSIEVALAAEIKIRILSLPYFLATKFEAAFSRGKRDLRVSHDIEDILYVLWGNANAVRLIEKSNKEVRKYLLESFGGLVSKREFDDILTAALSHRGRDAVQSTEQKINELASLL